MSRIIIWSPLAESDLEGIIEYLLENWSNEIILDYVNIVDSLIAQIENQPKMYPIINKKLKVRKCVLTKQNSLYYRENKERIEILRIYDNRQNPKKLKF
ncbi:MAG: type II toxin-antitoxin system RelE/ParE family toxin [Bacteroidia bacterium]